MWIRPNDYKVVGAYLTKVRKDAHLTQQAVAARLRKPQSFVSAYETSQRRIDVIEFLVIVEALGVDPRTAFADIVASRPVRRKTER